MLEACLLHLIYPHLISEKVESKRILNAIKIIQNFTNLPISVILVELKLLKDSLEYGVEIINDISGLKYDKNMQDIISKFNPSLILCAYSSKVTVDDGNHLILTKKLLKESLKIAKKSNISF